MTIHNSDLVVEKDDVTDFSAITEVTGDVYVYEGATLTAPLLKR